MSIGGLSGLASGVDTSSIVDQLISLERQANDRLALRKSAVQARQTALKDIASKLSALNTAAQDLSSDTTWAAKQTVASSDDARVGAVLIGGAGIGGHTIQVDRLASSSQRGYAFTPPTTAGTFTLAYANDPASTVTVDVAANATAADVAAAINGKSAAPVFASVLKDPLTGEDRLVLSARKTGEDSKFTLDATGLPGAFAEKAEYERNGAALNASYRLDGSATALSSQTNTIENAIAGVRVTLKGVTSSPETIAVGEPAVDTSVVKAKVKAFVDAYNAVVTATRAKTIEKTVANAATTSDAQKGQLFGDTGLLSMLSSLRIRMGDRMAGVTGIDELSDLGIAVPKSTGAASQDAKDGKLAIDDAKLTSALAADATKVKAFLGSFATGLQAYIKSQTGSGLGVLDKRDDSADAEIKRITDQISTAETRLNEKSARLKAQFAAMESALLQTQTQSAWLTGQISQLA
jgi:flagellar hook-associated protein 2